MAGFLVVNAPGPLALPPNSLLAFVGSARQAHNTRDSESSPTNGDVRPKKFSIGPLNSYSRRFCLGAAFTNLLPASHILQSDSTVVFNKSGGKTPPLILESEERKCFIDCNSSRCRSRSICY